MGGFVGCLAALPGNRPESGPNRPFFSELAGSGPEKSDLVVSGVRTKENLVNSVFCCFSWEKIEKKNPQNRVQ